MPLHAYMAPKNNSKTASYTIQPDEVGQSFDNLGAGAGITLTLPPIAQVWDGWNVRVRVIADFAVVVAGPAAGKLIVPNNAAAASIAYQTAAEMIGGGFLITYHAGATKYIVELLSNEAVTPTVA